MPGMESKPVFIDRENVVVFVFVVSLSVFRRVAIAVEHVLNKHFQNGLQISKSLSDIFLTAIFGVQLTANNRVSETYYLPIICYAATGTFGANYKYLALNNLMGLKTLKTNHIFVYLKNKSK